MTKFHLTILLLLLCAGAVCLPVGDPRALPISRLANWLCVVWLMRSLRNQIKH